MRYVCRLQWCTAAELAHDTRPPPPPEANTTHCHCFTTSSCHLASCQAPHCSAAVLHTHDWWWQFASLAQMHCLAAAPQQVASSATFAVFGAECGLAVWLWAASTLIRNEIFSVQCPRSATTTATTYPLINKPSARWSGKCAVRTGTHFVME